MADDRLRPSKAARLVGATGPRPATSARPISLTSENEDTLDVLRARIDGDYAVDDFGFDAQFTDQVLMGLMRPLYRHWFRVQVSGIDSIPADSGALVVANHSGTIAVDSVMTQLAILDEHPAHRNLRMLGDSEQTVVGLDRVLHPGAGVAPIGGEIADGRLCRRRCMGQSGS